MTFTSVTKSKNKTKQSVIQFIETLLCGLVGGYVFALLNLPLSWMLGPLTAVLLWKLFSNEIYIGR
ncbi:hypothetical protein [Psychrobacillus psychrodurans]|uniref:Uncharacterized protein n=1 Tax=Psychrobacillus psychrodurans TaxID=126157 RepID=A0A9X3LBC8_9BACI|nr:hypothetical protein [Psychrobacillus psychrodurans]MCZ8533079.1 hypothetical protein [Psychrobacillus psychrodurans]